MLPAVTDATPYAVRINHLKVGGAGALNGATLLNSTKVFDDAIADLMHGETELDWFFASALDLTDRTPVEVLN